MNAHDRIVTQPSYLCIRPKSPHREPFSRTVQINSDVLVDVGKDGHVLGIERLTGPVDLLTLYQLLLDERVKVVPS